MGGFSQNLCTYRQNNVVADIVGQSRIGVPTRLEQVQRGTTRGRVLRIYSTDTSQSVAANGWKRLEPVATEYGARQHL